MTTAPTCANIYGFYGTMISNRLKRLFIMYKIMGIQYNNFVK